MYSSFILCMLIEIGILIFLFSIFVSNELYSRIISLVGGILIGCSMCIFITSKPTVIDYMRGKVDVNIQETYIDSVLVKRDTIITYKK